MSKIFLRIFPHRQTSYNQKHLRLLEINMTTISFCFLGHEQPTSTVPHLFRSAETSQILRIQAAGAGAATQLPGFSQTRHRAGRRRCRRRRVGRGSHCFGLELLSRPIIQQISTHAVSAAVIRMPHVSHGAKSRALVSAVFMSCRVFFHVPGVRCQIAKRRRTPMGLLILIVRPAGQQVQYVGAEKGNGGNACTTLRTAPRVH